MKPIKIAFAIAALAIVVSACSPGLEDLTTVENVEGSSSVTAEVLDPDSLTVYRNVDNFPNIAVMCVAGDALITRSNNWNDYQVVHVPWGQHSLCESG